MDELAVAQSLFIAQCRAQPPLLSVFVYNDVPYTHQFLVAAATRACGSRFRFVPNRSTCPLDLQLDEYEEIVWDDILRGKGVANSYCVRKGLIRKANFAAHIARMLSKRPNPVLSSGIPTTLIINTWDAFQSTSSWGRMDT
jgi:tubulin--tyrosine ligase